MQFSDRIARRPNVLLQAAACDMQLALETLIAEDAERPPLRHLRSA